MLILSLDALLRSELLGQVRVAVPSDLVPVVEKLVDAACLPGPGRDAVRVMPTTGQGSGQQILAVLAGPDVSAARPVVVHDPLYPLVPAELVLMVLDAVLAQAGRLVAAVPVRPVTDTLKWVDVNDVVLGTADRDHFQMAHSPQAYWSDGLLVVLGSASSGQLREPGPEALPRLVQAAGGQLLALTAPEDMIRLPTREDVVIAEAVLDVVAGAVASGPPRPGPCQGIR